MSRADHRPLEREIAEARGLTPRRRSELDAGAKAAAMRFAWAVRARHAAGVQRVTAGMTRDELAALAVVLADAVNPATLLAVTQVADDGRPAVKRSPGGMTA